MEASPSVAVALGVAAGRRPDWEGQAREGAREAQGSSSGPMTRRCTHTGHSGFALPGLGASSERYHRRSKQTRLHKEGAPAQGRTMQNHAHNDNHHAYMLLGRTTTALTCLVGVQPIPESLSTTMQKLDRLGQPQSRDARHRPMMIDGVEHPMPLPDCGPNSYDTCLSGTRRPWQKKQRRPS